MDLEIRRGLKAGMRAHRAGRSLLEARENQCEEEGRNRKFSKRMNGSRTRWRARGHPGFAAKGQGWNEKWKGRDKQGGRLTETGNGEGRASSLPDSAGKDRDLAHLSGGAARLRGGGCPGSTRFLVLCWESEMNHGLLVNKDEVSFIPTFSVERTSQEGLTPRVAWPQ